ncbi:MAG: ABC transporter permease [Vicinamibacteria bacterium]
MRRVLAVARREYVERVRSKAFVIGTVLGPLLLGGVMLGPSLLMSKQRGRALRVSVVDDTKRVGAGVVRSLREQQVAGQARFEVVPTGEGDDVDGLRARVLAGTLDGLVHVQGETVEAASAAYYGRNVSNIMDLQQLERAVDEAVTGERLAGAGLPAERVRALTKPPAFKTIQLTAQGAREDRKEAFLVSAILLTLLYASIAMWGSVVMSGVLEEKTSRVVEVIVSSISTWDLFVGKLAGVGAAGLTQFAAWGVGLGLLGLAAAAGGLTAGAPVLGAGVLVPFAAYFLLGYFFYGALFAALGASVSSQQEAQPLQFIVMAPLFASVALFPAVLGNPDGTLAVTLSMIPFFTPLLMFLRISAVTPPAWQIALSILSMLLGIAGAVWLGARIYRVGILMYGKRMTFAEMCRWIRQP